VISPDERRLAYESDIDDGVTYRIFVRPFRGKGGEQPLSGAGGVQPLWSKSGNQRNGDKLFYATRQGEFWSVSVPREERWNPGAPDRLFPTSAILGPGNRDSQSPNLRRVKGRPVPHHGPGTGRSGGETRPHPLDQKLGGVRVSRAIRLKPWSRDASLVVAAAFLRFPW
jgi:hypothetical protein